MNNPYAEVNALAAYEAAQAAADLVATELQLGERDRDLASLIVNGAAVLLENPNATFADIVRAAHDTTEAQLRTWWTGWS
jgi:F420-dependent methylenetetrahydromethanopterin dehydrogenase